MPKFKSAKPYRVGKKPTKKRSNFVRKVSSYAGKAAGAWSLAKAAWKGFKYVKGMINCEKHFLDVKVADFASYSGTITPLSALSQGDNISNRIGDSVLAKYINLRYAWIGDTSTAQSIARVIVFQDTMSLGTIPAPGDVLNLSGLTTEAPLALLNLTYAVQGRFKILYDKTMTLCNTGSNVQATDEIIPINDHIKYTSTAGTDEGRNMVYLLYISNRNTQDPALNLFSRLAYYDN